MTYPQDPFGHNPFGSDLSGADPFGSVTFGPGPSAGPPGFTHPTVPRQPEANTFATLSVIFAFVFAPAGAVLGHLGLSQTRRTGQPGRRRAVIGLVASYIMIVAAVVVVLVWVVFGAGTTDSQITTQSPEKVKTPAAWPLTPLGPLRPPRDLRENAFGQKPAAPRWIYHHPQGPVELAGGDSRFVIVAGDDGVMAVDAESGNALWPRPFRPTGFSTQHFGQIVQANDCQIDRGDTAVACLFKDGKAKEGSYFFLDAATGAPYGPSVPLDNVTDDDDATYLRRSGNSFVVNIKNIGLRGYRPDGTLVWHADNPDVDTYTNYSDQGVIVPVEGDRLAIYDADTGKALAHTSEGLHASIAFAAGIVIEYHVYNDWKFVFHDFTGRQTAAIAADGFRLLADIRTLEPLSYESEPSTGVYQPLAYNNDTHELRAYDATGHVLWTKPVPNPDEYTPISQVFGSDTTCFIYHRIKRDAASDDVDVRVQACDQPSSNPAQPGTHFLGQIGGFDGQRILMMKQADPLTATFVVACLDITTGQKLWDSTLQGDPVWIGTGSYVVTGGHSANPGQLQRWL